MAESWVLSFFQTFFRGFLFFFGSWFCLAIAQKKSTTNQKTRNQETKKTKKDKKPKNKKNKHNRKKTRLHTPRGGVVAESWVLSFFQTFFCGFLFFFGSWFCLAIAQKINNEPENKKPRNQKNKKKQETKKQKKQKNRKKNKIAHPKGGSSGRELGLVIFSNVFLWFLVFFWILVLFSHCTKNQQRTRKQETKKPKKQKKNKKPKNKIGKKTRLHTPRGE